MAKRLLNLDDLSVKRGLMSEIGALRGTWAVDLKPQRFTRGLNANRYYFAAVVQPLADFLTEQWGERVSKEQAHEILKAKILGFKENEIDGVTVRFLPRSRELNTEDFANYIDSCAMWLAEYFGIVVAPAEIEHETATKGRMKNRAA